MGEKAVARVLLCRWLFLDSCAEVGCWYVVCVSANVRVVPFNLISSHPIPSHPVPPLSDRSGLSPGRLLISRLFLNQPSETPLKTRTFKDLLLRGF